ncbi:cytochrome P450 [Lentithecium fluviatile CBS 122367]|uniref:Cytochrome P450 n=1 Tax=Lentithecium fluviatile CBS 122367 TaxID=1168545 RepID=A0A6G1JHE0_9PLEO|nr:cytochrome P450 [Lentithecium fluviatile CBS 122367]
MESILLSHPFLLVAGVALMYTVAGAVYRLYLSPIAKFPGPKLAALTFWYEFYYDVLLKGRYTWKIKELHAKYGPVVRINPGELHVADSTFYDSVYVGPARRTEKWEYSARMFGTSLAAVGTCGHELHRLRRSALNGFFSRRSISKLEPTIERAVYRASQLLKRRGSGRRIINLRNFFAAFSADVIGEVAFGSGYGLLDRPDFEPGWQQLMMDLSRATHLMKQFSWAYAILNSIPPSFLSLVHPLTKRLFSIRRDIHFKIEQTKAALAKGEVVKDSSGRKGVETDNSTVLHSLLTTSSLPADELSTPRLEDEAFTLLGAGTITTAHTLTTIIYYVLANPAIKARLESDLAEQSSNLSSEQQRPVSGNLRLLERSKYLSAVVSEGLRLSFGVSHRLPRISPDAVLHYQGVMNGKEWDFTIPPGVPVSMSPIFIHLDPTIYHSPRTFDPQRWLDFESDTENDKAELRRRKQYLVPFSKGTRVCAGMHLAYAELYLMLGALFIPGGVGTRLELYGTRVEDVECVHDFFNPSPRLDSKGVRVVLMDDEAQQGAGS